MGKVKNLVGKRFGQLVVFEECKERQNKKVMWLCQCDCGNKKIVAGNNLKSGTTTTCGGYRHKADNLTGMRFGHLFVIGQGEPVKSGNGTMGTSYCKCDCGNYKVIRNHSLKNGLTKSCGCGCEANRAKILNKSNGNIYDLSGEYGLGKASNADVWFKFDLDDYDKIKDYSWSLSQSRYIICHQRKVKGYIYLHKFVMNEKNSIVDHINGDSLDDRKSNLRKATNQQNSMNHGKSINNTSGVCGVSWNKDKQRWKAYIAVNRKQIHLGYFKEDEFELAVKARKEAELKYFGEFARQNE